MNLQDKLHEYIYRKCKETAICICSYNCDKKALEEMEKSMPGYCGRYPFNLDSKSLQSLNKWKDK